MKIKMLTLMAGPDGTRHPGQVYDLPQKEAEELVAGGYAERVESAKAGTPSEPRVAARGRGRTATLTEGDAEEAAG